VAEKNKQIFMKWLKINGLFFVGAFIVALLLAFLFTDTMLGFVRSWGAYGNSVSPTVLEPTSKTGLFINILTKNSFMTILYFLASLLFLAPLIAIMSGIFYSLGLMSAIDHFVKGEIWYPLWHSPVLISIEVSFILLAITFASALATEIFGVKPERKEIMNFWKKNWKKLSPEQKRNWSVVFKENKKELILFSVVILALLLFGAWFEVWGY
jgi:hypothetical protein